MLFKGRAVNDLLLRDRGFMFGGVLSQASRTSAEVLDLSVCRIELIIKAYCFAAASSPFRRALISAF